MKLCRIAGAAALGWLVVFPATVPIEAQSSADLFGDTSLQEIRLLINSRDLQLLRDQYLLKTYYPADLVWKGQRIRNVGVRSRGAGSRSSTKLGILVDFDRYTTNQQFLGLGTLVLDNAWQDPSLIREYLAMKVYQRMGQVAPREVLTRLYINNVYQGLYVAVEALDPGFVTRTFGASDGYLYEYHYERPYFFEDLGDNLAAYGRLFEPQSHLLESDTQLYGPLRELLREVNGPDDAVWRERVDARLDLPQFMAHVAVQGCLAQNDGILGYSGINNFYLYRPNGSQRHRVLPWDEDFAFGFPADESSIFRKSDQGTVALFERAYEQPELKTVFLDAAEGCARTIGDEQWLLGEIDRVVALITTAVIDDTRKQFTTAEFLEGVEFLREFARIRTERVLAEVASRR
jgi:spore coat protein CotH